MKTRIYSDNETMFFPIYAYTSSVNILQNAVDRPSGYHMDQIFLVENGNGILSIYGKTYYLEEGDLFYISANIGHSYIPTDEDFSTTYISFFGNGVEKVKEYYALGNYGVYKKKSKGDFKIAVQELYDKLDEVHETPVLCALTFSAVIVFLKRHSKRKYHISSKYIIIWNQTIKKIFVLKTFLSFIHIPRQSYAGILRKHTNLQYSKNYYP